MRKNSPQKIAKKVEKPNYQFFLFLSAFIILLVALLGFLLLTKNKGTSQIDCANSASCIKDLSGMFSNDQNGIFMGKYVKAPSPVTDDEQQTAVLGQTTAINKHIYVDLSKQYLYAYEDGKFAFGFPVSTGKWHLTPTGDFNIWIKLRATRMVGGDPKIGTYYNLPNVQYTMYFYNKQYPKSDGYGLHEAYWHNNFGHPMSHGCINISTANAKKLYDWADPPTAGFVTNTSASNPGTPVTIFGTTPKD